MKKILLLFIALLFCHSSFACDLDKMIGQMILVGFKGESVNSKEYTEIKRQIENGEVGGVILFEFNVRNKKQLKSLTNDLMSIKSEYKPFISVDQEGGRIQILKSSNGFKDYLSAQDTANKMSLSEAFESYDIMARELRENGFNLDFAPVVDLNINKNSIISQKGRSYSSSPNVVFGYASEFIDANYKNNIISTLKHFPGHGSPSGDTHKGFVDATNTWDEIELLPYKKLINRNELEMVMVSHIYIKGLDKKYPSSLSKNIVQGLLRDKLGFDGVVITDDLYMGAISDNYSLEEIVIRSINAGVDVLLFSNYDSSDMQLPKKIHKIVKEGIERGDIKKERIVESYNRIIKLKNALQMREDLKKLSYDDIINEYEGKNPHQWGENADGVITKIKTRERILALTLDACGSKNDSLDLDLINFLIENKIPATLFINGRWIKKHPEYFEMLSSNPLFEIENHGISHRPASINGKSIYNIDGTKNVKELIEEIDENGLFIEKLTGKKPIFFRSGTAYYDEYAVQIANKLGYGVMGFSILGDRGATYSKKQVERALLKAKSGDIIICHMNHPEKETGKGLIKVLPKLLKKGYKFVKLEDYRNLLY